MTPSFPQPYLQLTESSYHYITVFFGKSPSPLPLELDSDPRCWSAVGKVAEEMINPITPLATEELNDSMSGGGLRDWTHRQLPEVTGLHQHAKQGATQQTECKSTRLLEQLMRHERQNYCFLVSLLGAEVALPGDLEPGAVGLVSLPLLDVVGELVSGGEAAEVGEDVGVADGDGDLEGDAGGLVAPEIELGAVGGEVADVVSLLNPIPKLGHLAGQGLGVADGGLVLGNVDDLESLTLHDRNQNGH